MFLPVPKRVKPKKAILASGLECEDCRIDGRIVILRLMKG